MNNICLIPVRGGSKRVPKKNIVDFYGKPLITYTIEVAVKSNIFESNIYVSSDSEDILNIANSYDNVQKILRPKKISGDNATLIEVMIYFLKNIEQKFDYLCLLQANCPLRNAEDIKKSYDIILKSNANCLLSVVDYYWLYPFRALEEKDGYLQHFFSEKYAKDSKKFPKNIYCPTGAITWVKISSFLKEKKIYGKKLIKYEIPFERSVDIDTYKDLELAKKIYKIIKLQ